jgi:uncharacterized protein (DUF2236 family)
MRTARTHRERMTSRDGYFPPESVIRRLGNEALVPLLGGGPAVLMQMAHPLVAAGVARHSDFQENLWRRLVGTLRSLYLIAFGTKAEAEHVGAIVQAVHRSVVGRTEEAVGRYARGTRYDASDPELMLCVHATLIHSSLAVYTRLVSPLSDDEQEQYYREMSLVARIFGTPAEVLPPTLGDFREYIDAELAGSNLCVGPAACDVAAVILRARVPPPLMPVVPTHRLSTAGILPEELRREYGLWWTPAHAAALAVAARSLRLVVSPLLLAASRVAPIPEAA